MIGFLKNCVFHDNSNDGIYGYSSATIHLHGEATAIHSNGIDGIYAFLSAKVIIHLPSHHNTSFCNMEIHNRLRYILHQCCDQIYYWQTKMDCYFFWVWIQCGNIKNKDSNIKMNLNCNYIQVLIPIPVLVFGTYTGMTFTK